MGRSWFAVRSVRRAFVHGGNHGVARLAICTLRRRTVRFFFLRWYDADRSTLRRAEVGGALRREDAPPDRSAGAGVPRMRTVPGTAPPCMTMSKAGAAASVPVGRVAVQ